MSGEGGTPLARLQAAIREFLARDERAVDLKDYRVAIDALEGDFSAVAREAEKTGEHLVSGNITAASWISRTCAMSVTSAFDRLCVGAQLESLPRVAAALGSGEISYQSASALCHLRERLGEKAECFDEEEMLGYAREYSVSGLRKLCRYAWHIANPDGFFAEAEADFSRRRLHISLLADGMHAIDGVLDPLGGAALKTALDGLARRQGAEDERTRSQRMADAAGELALHAMDRGHLPRRNGVRPHVSVTTTLEGLKCELGAPPAELEHSLPISTRSLERIACDSTVSRVLLAGSVVIDVGRATRVVSAPARRALRVRDKGCRFPGCDRQVDWSSPHHIVAWSRGGPSNLPNLVLLCYFHHRLVHEGGWQVIRSGRELRFLPPERVVMRRARGPGVRWAA
ncbi:MAG TPA: DUF222 domain-containing protein [Gemmatimonadales bacterium]|nr:DUF222 domain-containing protein [Gemmatimonadales bacterium]